MNKMPFIWTITLFLALVHFSLAQTNTLNLMPVPSQLEIKEGKFRLSKNFDISITGNPHSRIYAGANRFLRRLDGRTGVFFDQGVINVESNPKSGLLIINIERAGKVVLHEDESYSLKINKNNITLNAKTDIGALRGLETLLQLTEADSKGYFFPGIEIIDKPRFDWRGLMIDAARHFQPVEVIKRNLDAMAAVKLNVFHFHLSDDQGFRVESKKFPKLHEKASDGLYYTQAQIRDIVQYASDRGIRVMPEIDVPGHATAILVAYPEYGSADQSYSLVRDAGVFDPTLNPINDKTYDFLEELFNEVSSLFPDEYFHIGGDENEGKHWDANKEIQAFMKANNIANNHELQAHFNKRLIKIVEKMGKKMVGWEEILADGLPKSSVIHAWRGAHEGQKPLWSLHNAAKKGYETILSDGYYIDRMLHTDNHYLVDPLPANSGLSDAELKNVVGGEATMWSELVTPETIDSRIWPRMAAIAERFWSPQEIRDLDDMYRRLDVICFRLEELGLTHLKNKDQILRNLTGNKDISSLKTLVDVVEPLKGYTRNPGGTMYHSYSPYTLFADAAVADSKTAREFHQLVEKYIAKRQKEDYELIFNQLKIWAANHQKLKKVIALSPVLNEIEEISANLSEIAKIGIEALSLNKNNEKGDGSWYEKSLVTINNARAQGGRTDLQVTDPIEKLLKALCGRTYANFTPNKIKVDGSFNDWSDNTQWNYFVPTNYSKWNDTTYYSLKWDDKNLYIAFKVSNENLQAKMKKRDGKNLHMDDGVEFLIDTENDKSENWEKDDIAYHINIYNAVTDDRGLNAKKQYNSQWNGKAKTAVKTFGTINNPKDKDIGYHVEIAISWKELGKTPSESLVMGLNLCTNDRDDLEGKYRYYDYMNLNVFHKPSGFMELALTKESGNASNKKLK